MQANKPEGKLSFFYYTEIPIKRPMARAIPRRIMSSASAKPFIGIIHYPISIMMLLINK